MKQIGSLIVAAALAAWPQSAVPQDRQVFRCDVTPAAGKNSKKTPAWIELDVDFFTGKAIVTMPGMRGIGQEIEEGRVRRDTDELFAVTWRALVELGFYRPSSILDHRITIKKATNTGLYRSETIRGKGNLSGKVRCKRR